MTADFPTSKSHRAWRRWVLPGVVALIGLAGVAGWLWQRAETTHAQQRLAAVVAALDQQDPRWRLDDLRPALLPDADNSMRIVRQALDAMGDWRPADMKQRDGAPIQLPRLRPNRRLDDERISLIREALQTHARPAELARSLKDFPRGHSPIDFAPDVRSTKVPQAQQVREIVQFLDLDCERHLHAGESAVVPDRVRAMLHAGAGLRDDPLLLCQQMRMSARQSAVRAVERLLALGEVDDASCKRLADDLAAERQENLLLTAMRGERAAAHFLCENLAANTPPVRRFLADAGVPDAGGGWFALYRLAEDHAAVLAMFTALCDIARLPIEKQLAEMKALDEAIRSARQQPRQARLVLTNLLTPAVAMVGESAVRDQAQLSCAITALAVERYRLANKRWPKSLAELRPAYLSVIAVDLYDGGSLKFATHADGVVVYAVGKDGKDDGGDVVVETTGQSKDVGIRLYEVAKRNLPASAR